MEPPRARLSRHTHGIIGDVSFPWAAAVGFFLGFAFGVGCALAVLYSIFLGGYRAALRDLEISPSPPRLLRARARQVQSGQR